MKIVILSLLRIGDLIMAMPAIRGVARQQPNARVTVVINDQFMRHISLFDTMDGRIQFVGFPREQIQEALAQVDRPLREGEMMLEEWIQLLENGSPFDELINLTHNRLSGLLSSLIRAKARKGLSYDESGRALFTSAWVRQMNLQADGLDDGAFHFMDLLMRVAGLPPDTGDLDWGLKESSEGLIETSGVLPGRRDFIAIQTFTSDTKKDWGLANFLELESQIRRRWPDRPLVYLGAGDEIKRIHSAFLGRPDANRLVLELSLPGVFSLLKRAALLVTGDTSIKHIGAAARCPLIEIALGPSQPALTGAVSDQAVVVSSKESCQPCVPSAPCHRSHHACAHATEVEAVSLLASDILDQAGLQVSRIASEFSDSLTVRRITRGTLGFVTTTSLCETSEEGAVVALVDQFVRALWLDIQDDLRSQNDLAAEARRLNGVLIQLHPDMPLREWKFQIADLERQLSGFLTQAEGLRRGVKALAGKLEDRRAVASFVAQMRQVRQQTGSSTLLRSLTSQFEWAFEDDITQPFVRLRRIIDTIQGFDRRSQITKKVLECLRGGFEDVSETEEQI
jgi:ADP-heptose:LPS heptosyltransferase